MNKVFKFLSHTLICFFVSFIISLSFVGCKSDNPIPVQPDKILYKDGFKYECFKICLTDDSLQLYNCNIFDSLSNLRACGKFVKSKDNVLLPVGWIKHWDESGRLFDKVQYNTNLDSQNVTINQVIAFGKDSLDTIFSKSHYLTRNLYFLSKDSVLITFKYRGAKSLESNYAYTSADGKDTFVFRTSKPEISFKLPLKLFKNSTLELFFIKSYDDIQDKDRITMEFIFYDIEITPETICNSSR